MSKVKKTDIAVLVVFSLYAFWLDPRLIYMVQVPGFQWGWDYVINQVRYPGGFTEMLSALTGQFLSHRWSGTVILTAYAAILIVSTSLVVERTEGRKYAQIRYAPFLIYGGMLGTYAFAMESLIATICTILLALLYLVYLRFIPVVKYVSLVIISILLYFMTAGAPEALIWQWTVVPVKIHVFLVLSGWTVLCVIRNYRSRGNSLACHVREIALITVLIAMGPIVLEWYFADSQR